jgi:hypothetical protein
MVLADGIDLPLLMLWGFGAVVPLTLLVSFIEAAVLEKLTKIPLRKSFLRVVWANVLSTLAGVFVYNFQPLILYGLHSCTRIDLAQFYLPAALALILLYYGVSVLVEGWVLTRSKFVAATAVNRRQLWRGVLWANAASYLVVGPLFYFGTRPEYPGVTLVKDAAAVTSSEETVYYCRAGDEFLCSIAANGANQRVLVPFPVRDFVVSANQESFAYRGPDNNLYYYRNGLAQPSLVWTTSQEFLIRSVDISPDGRRVGFLDGNRAKVFELKTGETVVSEPLVFDRFDKPFITWDGSNNLLIFCQFGESYFETEREYFLWDVAEKMPVKGEVKMIGPLCLSFRRCRDGWLGHRGSSAFLIRRDSMLPMASQQGDYEIQTGVRGIWFSQGDKVIRAIQTQYGMLEAPRQGAFLTEPGIIVCEGDGQINVFDGIKGKLGPLVAGCRFVIANKRFQMSLATKDGDD